MGFAVLQLAVAVPPTVAVAEGLVDALLRFTSTKLVQRKLVRSTALHRATRCNTVQCGATRACATDAGPFHGAAAFAAISVVRAWHALAVDGSLF